MRSYFLFSAFLLIGFLQVQAQTAEDFFKKGTDFLNKGDYKSAIKEYDQAIALKGDYELAYFNRGLSKFYLQMDQAAIEDYSKAIQIRPSHDTYYNRGLCYYYLKDYKTAHKDFTMALNIQPQYSKALFYRGLVNYFLKEDQKAIEDLSAALKVGNLSAKDAAEAHYYRGLAYYALKKDAEAEIDLSEAIRKGANGVATEAFLADYHYYRATVSYLLKKYPQAAQDYAQAIKLNAKYAENPENYYQMGLANTYAQNYEPAIEAYDRAILLGNTNKDYLSDYYYGRGWARMGQKNYEVAIKDFDESLRLKKTTNGFYNRALCKYYLYRDPEALEDYSSALAIDPKYANALYNRGLIYYNSKRYKEAIADYSKVIEIEGQSTDALNYRGLCYYNLKQYKEAIAEFDKAIAANPAYKSAYTNRALAKHEIGDEKGSEADFKKAKDLEGGENNSITNNPNDRAETKSKNDLDFDAAGNLKLPKIWALVVGVSEYQNGRINLKYADKDATLFFNFLKSDHGGRVPDEQIVLLTNKEATRANIIKNLKKVSFRAHPDDIFIFYIAGHGQISSTQKGKEVYFLPYDLDSENIDGTALAQGEIQQYMAASQAKKKIWIADACHSGGAGLSTGIIRDPNDNITRFLNEIATSNDSFVILTASRGNEYSFENAQWGGGHGVFTHYLVEGLKGAADKNKNKIVEISELYNYLFNKVADATNDQQHPELKGNFDNRLPLGLAK